MNQVANSALICKDAQLSLIVSVKVTLNVSGHS